MGWKKDEADKAQKRFEKYAERTGRSPEVAKQDHTGRRLFFEAEHARQLAQEEEE